MIQILISDETSQDSIAATPKTENPFYQCPHCDDNFDSFDDVTNHIEDEHENNETGKNFVSFCVILCHFMSFCPCWTVGAIFTFCRSRMFGPEKLRPLAVDRSRSRRLKECKIYVIKLLISNHSI